MVASVIDGWIHMIDWQRNKVAFKYEYPGGKILTFR
jgi:hypothetical protein